MIGHRIFSKRWMAPLAAIALVSAVAHQQAAAATFEQIVEACKQSVRPQFMACMQSKAGNGAGREANAAACRSSLTATVRACATRETQRAAAGKAAPAAPKAEETSADDAAAPQPAFVAPPRTIADITAVLDAEKARCR